MSEAGHCGYPSEYLVVQTWNTQLARSLGEAIGDELLVAGMSGWCAPALSCHRYLYATASSNAMNGRGPTVRVTYV
ncbi:hypothetical protein [Thermophilibacter immobilis]|uniref:Uncharacterized protein n=1 Tax=Thermophilibacter immobilis TaxID=2779519 RepID=A0A7S7MAQ3_9ACTN|nr:hypothetical protein [Thermophilibacter immobilis]QOY60953.1 hypothetical protein INP52_01705 [Thermophilibacter immobilis]